MSDCWFCSFFFFSNIWMYLLYVFCFIFVKVLFFMWGRNSISMFVFFLFFLCVILASNIILITQIWNSYLVLVLIWNLATVLLLGIWRFCWISFVWWNIKKLQTTSKWTTFIPFPVSDCREFIAHKLHEGSLPFLILVLAVSCFNFLHLSHRIKYE